ncbi:hypothetical protein N7532_007634 [Penicillium argentinense]|uniref:Uncharacterized protein n=1 Tax=Penicillium argentinense TaxID=1131581 RepID=A0A9W9K140_9EURO|nr:uncharacterized protein N7532_007634 [Penicillium argentinense]KAJ5088950.1 hypothetical protein N7532_007634 [Penicillium argentinense]
MSSISIFNFLTSYLLPRLRTAATLLPLRIRRFHRLPHLPVTSRHWLTLIAATPSAFLSTCPHVLTTTTILAHAYCYFDMNKAAYQFMVECRQSKRQCVQYWTEMQQYAQELKNWTTEDGNEA